MIPTTTPGHITTIPICNCNVQQQHFHLLNIYCIDQAVPPIWHAADADTYHCCASSMTVANAIISVCEYPPAFTYNQPCRCACCCAVANTSRPNQIQTIKLNQELHPCSLQARSVCTRVSFSAQQLQARTMHGIQPSNTLRLVTAQLQI